MPRAPVCTVQVTGAGLAVAPHQLQATAVLSLTGQVSRGGHHMRAGLHLFRGEIHHLGMLRHDTTTIARRLATLPAFATCRMRDLQDLATSARHSSVPANWPLIHQDTPADSCYVILDGTATVAIAGTPVATLDAGAVVGEMALATGRLRNATVTSVTPLDLLHIDAAEFQALLDRRPALREALLARVNAVAATT
jgi:CRP/FNR family cyclic AMP-dependent transcriptional regulator